MKEILKSPMRHSNKTANHYNLQQNKKTPQKTKKATITMEQVTDITEQQGIKLLFAHFALWIQKLSYTYIPINDNRNWYTN